MQLAWPFALIGAAVGAQLPVPFTSGFVMAVVLGVFGALVTSALPHAQDWQVALMSPFVGAATGATIGCGLDRFDGAVVGVVGGIGFGLFALPSLLLITDGARRARKLPAGSPLERAQRRRVWLLALSTSALAALIVPALTNPWSHPAEAPFAQLTATALMILAMFDATSWIALTTQAHSRPATPEGPPSANPYREMQVKTPKPDHRMLAVLAAESLLYDALIVGVVASALLVSR